MPPRLIRRRPLAERIKAYLDPVDFLLWLSEEMDSSDWDKWQRDWASTIGLSINLVFLLARANSGHYSDSVDEVFGDGPSFSSWVRWFVSSASKRDSSLVCALTTVSRTRFSSISSPSFHLSMHSTHSTEVEGTDYLRILSKPSLVRHLPNVCGSTRRRCLLPRYDFFPA